MRGDEREGSAPEAGPGKPGASYRIGIDIGGTFTDIAVSEEATGEVRVFKALSDQADPLSGIVDGIALVCEALGCTERAFVSRCSRIVHGTTIGTNAIIQRDGPAVGLIATRGFRDVLEFMDGTKPDPFNIRMERPAPLVPRHRRLGVGGRLDYRGVELEPLDEDDVRRAAAAFRAEDVRSIAVALLWSQVNPRHEHACRAILAEELPDVPVVISSDVLPQLREWDRTCATVLSAYTLPAMSGYLARLRDYLRARGGRAEPLIIQCNGGSAPIDRILEIPSRSIGSGPAAAPAAAVQAASEFFRRDDIHAVSIDMGGTSFDVALLRGGMPALTRRLRVAGMPLGSLAADIVSIGAGGGSIASVDSGGALAVGPRSAGADPGPACYGRGGREPTVTDAFVALGYVAPEAFLGGRMKLDRDKALAAIDEAVAGPLGLGVVDAAAGIFRLANFKMVKAIAAVSVERGIDPRGMILVCGGGAGGIVVGALAAEFGVERVLIPRVAGGYSAFGMTVVDVTFDYTRTATADSDSVDVGEINRMFADMEAEARRDLAASEVDAEEIAFQWFYDAAYWGQAHELIVPLAKGRFEDTADLRGAFDREHERVYSFMMPDDKVNFLHWRLNAIVGSGLPVPRREAARAPDPATALIGRRDAWFGGEAGRTDLAVYDGARLRPGHVVAGPAVIEEPTTSVTVFSGDEVRVCLLGYDYRARGGGRS